MTSDSSLRGGEKKRERGYENTMSCEIPDSDFPVESLLPKKETEILSYLAKYPENDGRNVVIAILDSGVDPGAPGLQVTSVGTPKIIERFDCSGCGDVDTSSIVKPKDGHITGLTGRSMKLPPTWTSQEYRVGVINAFNLYPDRVKDRVKSTYKKKHWDEGQRKIVSQLNREIAEFDNNTSETLDETQKFEKEDREAKLEILTNLEKKFSDAGPIYDCVLFKENDLWKCCVNTSDTGDLSTCPLLGEFSRTHEYCHLTDVDNLNISFNVHENGNVLELVGVCSSHGTHVASIAAGYFPANPAENGVAPGAQIISLTIGDGRLGSMETGTALIRAMIKLIELSSKMDIHVINMSYGEHAHWVDTGRIGSLVNEIVNKYGIIWVSSAGNNGPALGTISTPSDINDEPIISVGAYVSPDMMVAEYAMRQKLPGAPYTWSSRGPTIDGGIGVHLCAPGGAITSVPQCSLRYSQLMNGTSMASPNCAGAICVLISGMMRENKPFTPYIIRRALENTCTFIDRSEILAQGAGLIQVDAAFEYLRKYYNVPERNVRFQIHCGSSNSKGIYVRSKAYTNKHTFKVGIEPKFLNEDAVPADEKVKFNMKLVLICKNDYVLCPKHLDISNAPRLFTVSIDTAGLPDGLHTTFINAYDTSAINKGPVFKIPITVIQPREVTDQQRSTVDYIDVLFDPNTIKRHYYTVPSSATWAVVKMISSENTGRFVVHTMQCLPRQHCKALETMKIVDVTTNSESQVSFQVHGDNVLEVVVAKYWASTGLATLNYSISFYGVKPNQPFINMHAADGIHTVEVKTLQGEDIAPTVVLKNSVQILKPSDAKVQPLADRDVIPPARQIYELVLVYNFSITKACEISPNLTLLSDMLYESEYESQLWLLFDANKQYLGSGDAYPSKYTVKVEKGDYVIRLQVRHDKKEYLEKMNEAPLLLQQKLAVPIPMDLYSSYTQALIGGKKAGAVHNSNPYSVIPFYIAPLAADKFPVKTNNTAHYLTGIITFAKDDVGKRVDTYPIKYFLADISKTASKSNVSSPDKTKSDEYHDALRDLTVSWIPKQKEGGDLLYEQLIKSYPNHLPTYSAYLQLLDPLDKRILPSLTKRQAATIDELKKIIGICEKVLEQVKEETILAYMAIKTDMRPDAVKVKTQMEQHRNVYLECLARKGIALCRLQAIHDTDDCDDTDYNPTISTVWRSLVKFIDPSDAKVITSHVLYFAIWHAYTLQHYGRLLKYFGKLQEDKPSEDVQRKIIDVYVDLKFHHVAAYLLRQLPSEYPTAYRPF